MGMSAVTLEVLLRFLLKDGPVPESAADIYSSCVNVQGVEIRGVYHLMELYSL